MKKQPRLLKKDNALLPLGAMMCGIVVAAPVAMAQANDQELKTVIVKDSKEADALNLNEHDGYQATTTRIGKQLQDPHDIPQAVTIITRDLIDDQGNKTLKDSLRNVAGLTFNAAEGGRAGDNMNIRGFYSFGDLYMDGMRDTAQYYREMFNMESVEVLRGAGSMLFGRGQAGGVISTTSKTPKLKDANKIGLAIGSNAMGEARADLNKKLGETTAIRVNLMHREEGSFRSNVETGTEPGVKRTGIAPSIAFGIGTHNQFTLSHYYVKSDDKPDFGINFKDRKPISDNYRKFSGDNRVFDKSETNITTLAHTYRFSNATEVNTKLRRTHVEREYAAVKPNAAGKTSENFVTRAIDVEDIAFQVDISHKTKLAGMQHELLAGVEYFKEDGWRDGLRDLGNKTFKKGEYSGNSARYTGDTYSVFLQDQIEFVPNWKLLLGVRHDDMDARYSNAPNMSYSTQSYRTGLSWQPNEEAHYYLTWSDSVNPTADLNQIGGGAEKEERSSVIELGAKWLLLDGDLALRASAFKAEKKNERNLDLDAAPPAPPRSPLLTKKRTTDGVELEVAGRITPQWEVFAGAAFYDAEVTTAARGASKLVEGKRPRNTPTHTVNLWSTYKFAPKWKFGLGMDYKSDVLAYNPNMNANTAEFKPNKVPSYYRWDAMLSYTEKNYSVQLNVNNLFDVEWYDGAYDNGGWALAGAERTFVLSTEVKF